MDLNTIKNTGNWGSSASRLNENFSKVGTEVDKLKYAAYNSKLYASEALLKQAIPSPSVGDWAIVGNAIPGEIYRCDTDGEWTATGQTGGGYGMEVTEKHVTEQYVTEVHNEYTGDIVNNPDDEDLISEELAEGGKVLKLADKMYNASAFSGMGRVYLRKNISGNKNLLTQAMVDGMANTRFIVQYDYDLNGEAITIPKGCILDFQGGSISNGTVIGVDTIIKADYNASIFRGIQILGSITNDLYSVKWFGANGKWTDDYENKAEDAADRSAFKEVIALIQSQKKGLMYIPKGVYSPGHLLFNFTGIPNFHAVNKGATIGIIGEGSLTSVLIFEADSDGVYFNTDGAYFAEVKISDIQIYGKSGSTYDFTGHNANDYIHETLKYVGDNAGLLLNLVGYKSSISRININGFRIGFACTKAYGGPDINNVFVAKSGVGYIGKDNTSTVHTNCNYNGIESGYMAVNSTETITNIVSEGSLKSFNNADINTLAVKFLGHGFYAINSKINMDQCYTEYLFGASRKIVNSFVNDINGIIGNSISYYITTSEATQYLKDYVNSHKEDTASISFASSVWAGNIQGGYYGKPSTIDVNETLRNIDIAITNGNASGNYISDACELYLGKYIVKAFTLDLNVAYQNSEVMLRNFITENYIPNVIYDISKERFRETPILDKKYDILLDSESYNQYVGSNDIYNLSRYNTDNNLQTENYGTYNDGTNGYSLTPRGNLDSTIELLSVLKKVDKTLHTKEVTKTTSLVKFFMRTGKVLFNKLAIAPKPSSVNNAELNCLYLDLANYSLAILSENSQKFINPATGSTYCKVKGTTSERPSLGDYIEDIGAEYYDTTLKKKIIWNGTKWTNVDGTSL